MPLATAALMVAVLVARALALGRSTPSVAELIAAGAKDDIRIHSGEWWRLLSAGLLHASPTHLALNAVLLGVAIAAWVRLGREDDEASFGRAATALALAVFSSVGGFAASTLAQAGPSIGASAAAYGMLAAVVVSVWVHRDRLPPTLRRRGPLSLTAAFAAVVVVSVAARGVDHMAHAGGVIAGIALAPLGESRARVGLVMAALALIVAALIAAA